MLFVCAMLFASVFSHIPFLLENRLLLQPRTDKVHLHAGSMIRLMLVGGALSAKKSSPPPGGDGGHLPPGG